MQAHSYRPNAGDGSCYYREPSTARVCGGRKEDEIHTGYADVPAGISSLQGVGRSLAKAFTIPSAQTPEALPAAVQAWDAYAAQVRDTILRKSVGYGDAWERQGYMGNVARVLSKQSRIRNMCWTDSEGTAVDPDDEDVLDTLIDLGALCAFAVANIEEGNRWGS